MNHLSTYPSVSLYIICKSLPISITHVPVCIYHLRCTPTQTRTFPCIIKYVRMSMRVCKQIMIPSFIPWLDRHYYPLSSPSPCPPLSPFFSRPSPLLLTVACSCPRYLEEIIKIEKKSCLMFHCGMLNPAPFQFSCLINQTCGSI